MNVNHDTHNTHAIMQSKAHTHSHTCTHPRHTCTHTYVHVGKTFWEAATMRAFHFCRNHLFRCQAEIINLIYLNKLLYSEGHRMQLTVHWSHWGREHRYYWTPVESRSFDNTSHFTSSLTILFVMLLIFKLLLLLYHKTTGHCCYLYLRYE